MQIGGFIFTKKIKEKYSASLPGRDGFVHSRIEHFRTLLDDGDQKGMEKSITELINRLYIENRDQLDVFKARSVQVIDMFGRMIIVKAPEDTGFFEKLPAEMGMAISRMTDRSDSKTAELMINGYVMGVTELKKQLADISGISEQTAKLAGDLLQFQLGAICDMKRFL